jgi:ferredoxin
MFDTTLCIGCGECQSVCPSAALQLLPKGYAVPGASLPDRPTPLASFAERSCIECGRDFAGRGEENLCPQCCKRHGLARSAFQSIFGASR